MSDAENPAEMSDFLCLPQTKTKNPAELMDHCFSRVLCTLQI